MKFDGCGRFFSDDSKNWLYMDIEGSMIAYCSDECALRDNDLTTGPLCKKCGDPILDDKFFYDSVSGDIYCGKECAFNANGIKHGNLD